jgi:hypothetical protein
MIEFQLWLTVIVMLVFSVLALAAAWGTRDRKT